MSISPFPEVSASLQFNHSRGDFNALLPRFRDLLIPYGRPGHDILVNQRSHTSLPSKDACDDDGDYLYEHAELIEGLSKSERVKSLSAKVKLTAQGLSDFRYDEKLARQQMIIDEAHSHALLSCILAHLSPQSKVLLATLPDNRYEVSKLALDTFDVWQAVLLTHQFGSTRHKQHQFSQLLAVKQVGSHEDYLFDLRAKCSLVETSFASKEHKGHIAIDLLFKIIYINGLDQLYFERIISKLLDSKNIDLTLAECQLQCQHYVLERGPTVSASSTSYSGKAFTAEVPPAVQDKKFRFPVPGSLGPYVVGQYCSYCWGRGYKHLSSLADCSYKKKHAEKALRHKAFVGSELSAAPASPVAPSIPVEPLQSASAPSSLPPPLPAMDDQALVARYEHAAYIAARQRLSQQHGSFTASFACMVAAPVFFGSTVWYDNCCSYTIVNKLEFLVNCRRLKTPFRIGGISDGIFLTHRGSLPTSLLPDGLNDAFYSKDAQSCLLSLGFIHRAGGSYASVHPDKLVVRDKLGVVLDITPMCDNNLSPVSLQRLQKAYPEVADLLPVTYVAVAPHVSDSALHDCVPADLSINLSYPIWMSSQGMTKSHLVFPSLLFIFLMH